MFHCGDKYEPSHQAVCSKRQHLVNALAVNDLDQEEITDEMLNQLAAEDVLTADFYQLSLNTMTTLDTLNAIKLRTLVKNKVMLILVDSGSSNSFVSKQFTALAQLSTVPITPNKVKLANGEWITTSAMVKNLQWYI